MAEKLSSLPVSELLAYLKTEEDLDEDILSVLRTNKVTGAAFLELSDEHLKEMFTAVGDRLAVKRVLKKERQHSKVTLV